MCKSASRLEVHTQPHAYAAVPLSISLCGRRAKSEKPVEARLAAEGLSHVHGRVLSRIFCNSNLVPASENPCCVRDTTVVRSIVLVGALTYYLQRIREAVCTESHPL